MSCSSGSRSEPPLVDLLFFLTVMSFSYCLLLRLLLPLLCINVMLFGVKIRATIGRSPLLLDSDVLFLLPSSSSSSSASLYQCHALRGQDQSHHWSISSSS